MSQSAICTYRRRRRVNLPNQRPLDVQNAPAAQFTMWFDATTTTSWVYYARSVADFANCGVSQVVQHGRLIQQTHTVISRTHRPCSVNPAQ